jgi:two-component system cell cycle sensor histidine kinase/response regulator CckA
MVLFIVFKRKKDRDMRFVSMNIIVVTLIVASMVESMIFSFGGHRSTYYAGMIVVITFILGFVHISFRTSIVIGSLVYFIYVVPLLLTDNIVDSRIFINNNIFLIGTMFGAFGWKYFNHKINVRGLSLEYDLSQEKVQLEKYSTQLEELVQERTKELSISEKWHKSIFDNATDGVIVQDRNGTIINVNKKACEIHGFERESLIGVNIELLEARGDKKQIDDRRERILHGDSIIYETEHHRREGEKVDLEVSAKAIEIGGEIFIQSFYRDITEKKRIQEQLMHSQKMESVGALAGGIAHNFNNILTTILGYSELLLEFSELDETSKLRVRNIESSARKAGIMVSKLLSFARRETHEIVPLNLHDVINDSVRLFEGVLDKRIGIKMELTSTLQNIEGDPNQIEQILMNLMVNARDAMPDGGLITIRTEATDVGKDRYEAPAYIIPGKYIVLVVSDTGSGISKQLMSKIFDPFFTTKEKGKGTGLGLATVYGIVKDHKGYISVESEPGKGSTFSIYFPASEKVFRGIEKPGIVSIQGYENIMVVDDDVDVLNFVKEILENHGYQIMAVNNSLNAIDIFKSDFETIQLIITDIMMPLMEGPELIKTLKQIKPGIKVIGISGYSDTSVSRDKLVDVFIRKPFQSMELLAAVRRLLDTGTRKSPLY